MRSTYTLMFSVSLRSGHGFSRVVSAARAAGGSADAGEPGEGAAVWGEVTDPACHRLGWSAALGRRLGGRVRLPGPRARPAPRAIGLWA